MSRNLILGDTSVPHIVIAFAVRHSPVSIINRSTRPGARWTHTATWDRERGVFNEAKLFRGVVETPEGEWFDHYARTELLAVEVIDPAAGLAYAQAQVGKRYDYMGAASVPFRASWQDDRRWYCCEKELAVLTAAGRQVLRDPERGFHPHDLWRSIPLTRMRELRPFNKPA